MTKIIEENNFSKGSSIHVFHPQLEQTFFPNSLLTIENEEGTRTFRISQWLHEDPVSFDKLRRKYNIKINKEIFNILISKLRSNHPKYFIDALGLNVRIEFKGYDRPIKAIIPYNCNPIEFYKWWCLNQDLIHMTLAEKIILFDRVIMEDPTLLKREHRKMINKP